MGIFRACNGCFDPIIYEADSNQSRSRSQVDVGRRKRFTKANKVQPVIIDEISDDQNLHVECSSFSDSGTLRVKQTDKWSNLNYNDHEAVLVSVEASHVCPVDVQVRKGMVKNVKTPFVVGSNFVGVVLDGFLPKGTRVAGITKTGANARYLTASPHNLIPVPEYEDEAELVVLLSTYLPLFQALHHGKFSRRYSRASLRDQTILVTPGATLVEIQAIVKLALNQGATEVFVMCHPKVHGFIEKIHGKPLSMDSSEWLSETKGKIDLVLAFDYASHRSVAHSCLKPKGRLVWIQAPQHNWEVLSWFDQVGLCMRSRCFIYDLFESWDENQEMARVSKRASKNASRENLIPYLSLGRETCSSCIVCCRNVGSVL